MINFEYHAPKTIDDALEQLSTKEKTAVLAGGTDLVVQLKENKVCLENLVSLRYLQELKEITVQPNGDLKIGVMATISDIIKSPLVADFSTAIKEALSTIGSNQIRNMATIGGNICNASPAADSAPILLVLDSSVEIISKSGTKLIPLKNFFLGKGQTALKKGELLSAVIIPAKTKDYKVKYYKLGVRQSIDIAVVSVALALKIKDGICEDARIALGSVSDRPMRAIKTEELLKGTTLPDNLDQISENIKKECTPITDIRATADYRREMVGTLTKRGILSIC
ncbi:MAG TPA: xanthine dehydrogenase family protein subunit M [Oscillospiraceae bacterium]|nr:xanthine dehydrogenase family protein subunit M [Oscillospiraceae bacterium]